MTHVAIFPDSTGQGHEFRAVAGDKQSVGRTAGEALDALTPQLAQAGGGTLIIVQSWQADALFGAEQQRRLANLMHRWRVARDQGTSLSPEDQAELDRLVAEELQAAGERASEWLRNSGQ